MPLMRNVMQPKEFLKQANEKEKSKTIRKIQKLAQLAEDLSKTRSRLSTGRIITVKYLCTDLTTATTFALDFSKRALYRTDNSFSPIYFDEDTYQENKKIISKAILMIEKFLKDQTISKIIYQIRELLCQIKDIESKYEGQLRGWGENVIFKEVFIVEYTLKCVLLPFDASYFAYQVAREYSEEYNEDYGRGLIPESAPLVKEIADFLASFRNAEK